MSTSRKLEDIASDLDDMSVTIEEIKEEGEDLDTKQKLESLRSEMKEAAQAIDESLESLDKQRGSGG